MSLATNFSAQQAVQYILYESDSLEVTYVDGTLIQMSPCGTTFICQQPLSADRQHPINGITRIYVYYVAFVFDVAKL